MSYIKKSRGVATKNRIFNQNLILEDYLGTEGLSINELCKKYDTHPKVMRNIITDSGLSLISYKDWNRKRRLKEALEFEKSLIEDYQNPDILVTEIRKKYKTSYGIINEIIKKYNISKRDHSFAMKAAFIAGRYKPSGISKRTGTKNISGSFINRWIRNAKLRDYSYNITKEYLQELYEKQKGKCAYTGTELLAPVSLKDLKASRNNPYLISLDRIDNSIGYELCNLQFVCTWINKAKSAMSHEQFLKIIQDLKELFIKEFINK